MIKYLAGDQKTKSRLLYEEVFHDKKKFIDYYYNERIKDNKVLAGFEDSRIVSMLHRNPYILNIKNEKVRADYIYAVATKPDYRRRGYMSRLLTRALQDMYKDKISFAYLVPEDYKVYLPFGFGFIYDSIQFDYENQQKEIPVSKYTIKSADEDNIPHLLTLSKEMIAPKKDVFVYRDEEYFHKKAEQLHAEKGDFKILYYDNSPIGYCCLSNENSLEIDEFVCDVKEKDIFMTLLGKEFDFECIKISGILNPWEGCANVSRIMARILDVKEIGRYLHIEEDLKINIKVVDSVIQENNRVFTFECVKSECRITETDKPYMITMEIGELTQWLFGYRDFNGMPEMRYLHRIFMNDVV